MTDPSYDDERVRALLGELGDDLRAPWTDGAPGPVEPVPDDVVARLDDALAALAGERPSTVVPLVPRRRRAGRVLLGAAAALVLGGVAAGSLLPGLQGSSDMAGENESADAEAGGAVSSPAEDGRAAEEESSTATQDDADGLGVDPETFDGVPGATTLRAAPPRVRPDRLRADVVPLLLADLADRAALRTADACAAGPAALRDRATRAVEVRSGGRAAYVVLAPAGGAVDAALVRCGDPAVLADARLTVR